MLANAPTTRTMPFLLLAGSALASKATNGFATIDETNGASGLWWPINQQATAMTATDSDSSGLFLNGLARQLPLQDWLFAAEFNANLRTALVGQLAPTVVYCDIGELASVVITPMPSVPNMPMMSTPVNTQPPSCLSYFVSYYSGDTNEYAVEIYNGGKLADTDLAIIVAPIDVDWTDGEVLSLSSLAPNSSTIYAHSSATVTSQIVDVVKSIKFVLDAKHVLALRCQDKLIDFIGDVDSYDGTPFAVAGISDALRASSLSRRAFVTHGQARWSVAAGTNALDSEWKVTQPPVATWRQSRVAAPMISSRNCNLFFATYSEGKVKAVEIFNAAMRSASLSTLAFIRLTNGGMFADGTRYSLGSGILEARNSLVISSSTTAVTLSNTASKYRNLIVITGLSRINGNDALALECDGVIIDTIGAEGIAPDVAWKVNDVETATENHVLLRNNNTIFGNGGNWQSSATAASDSPGGWSIKADGFAAFTSSSLRFTPTSCTLYGDSKDVNQSYCCTLDVHCAPMSKCVNNVCSGSSQIGGNMTTMSLSMSSQMPTSTGTIVAVVVVLAIVVLVILSCSCILIRKKPEPAYRGLRNAFALVGGGARLCVRTVSGNRLGKA